MAFIHDDKVKEISVIGGVEILLPVFHLVIQGQVDLMGRIHFPVLNSVHLFSEGREVVPHRLADQNVTICEKQCPTDFLCGKQPPYDLERDQRLARSSGKNDQHALPAIRDCAQHFVDSDPLIVARLMHSFPIVIGG